MSNRTDRKRGISVNLQQLQTFQVVAATGSFTRAAAELGYSQSNVTHQVKTLEDKLGFALLNRYRFSRRVVLTEAGRRALDYSERILALAQGMLSKESLSKETSGS
jgi:DNA-binding transcriptional LysR family regulator